MYTKHIKEVGKILICILCFITAISTCCIGANDKKLNIYSKSYIAYDRTTKQVLFGKNIDTKVPMASTTKIMTAIITIEYGKLNEYVIASQNAQNITGWQLNLKKGDKILLNDLLYALLLYSANDGAIAIAEHIGGSVEGFCDMMNEKAKQIGALNTNFTSPHGLDNDMHYSTPYDLAIMMDYALNNSTFREIVSTPTYQISINGYGRMLNNTNKLLRTLDGCVGGKTGYTGKAGYCLVNNCKRNNMDIIAVVLGANTTKQRFQETKDVLDYAIDNYEIVNLNEYIDKNIDICINKGKEKSLQVIPNNTISVPVLKNDKEKICVEYEIKSDVIPPILQGQVLAYAHIYCNEKEIAIIEYSTQKDYAKITYWDYVKYILGNYITLLQIEL